MNFKTLLSEATQTDIARKIEELNKKLFKEYADWLYDKLDGDNTNVYFGTNISHDDISFANGFTMNYKDAKVNVSISSAGKLLNPTMMIKGKTRLGGKPCRTIDAFKKELVRLYAELQSS